MPMFTAKPGQMIHVYVVKIFPKRASKAQFCRGYILKLRRSVNCCPLWVNKSLTVAVSGRCDKKN